MNVEIKTDIKIMGVVVNVTVRVFVGKKPKHPREMEQIEKLSQAIIKRYVKAEEWAGLFVNVWISLPDESPSECDVILVNEDHVIIFECKRKCCRVNGDYDADEYTYKYNTIDKLAPNPVIEERLRKGRKFDLLKDGVERDTGSYVPPGRQAKIRMSQIRSMLRPLNKGFINTREYAGPDRDSNLADSISVVFLFNEGTTFDIKNLKLGIRVKFIPADLLIPTLNKMPRNANLLIQESLLDALKCGFVADPDNPTRRLIELEDMAMDEILKGRTDALWSPEQSSVSEPEASVTDSIALKKITEALKSGDIKKISEAVETAKFLGIESSIPILSILQAHTDPNVLLLALDNLDLEKDDVIVKNFLLKNIQHPENKISRRAFNEYLTRVPGDYKLSRSLLGFIHHEDKWLRERAWDSIIEYGKREIVAPEMEKILHETKDWNEALLALKVLTVHGTDSSAVSIMNFAGQFCERFSTQMIDEINNRFGTSMCSVRNQQMNNIKDDVLIRVNIALGNIGSRRALGYLTAKIAYHNYGIVKTAVEALGKIGDPAAARPLIDLFAERRDDWKIIPLRSAILEALGDIGTKEAVAFFIDILGNDELIASHELALKCIARSRKGRAHAYDIILNYSNKKGYSSSLMHNLVTPSLLFELDSVRFKADMEKLARGLNCDKLNDVWSWLLTAVSSYDTFVNSADKSDCAKAILHIVSKIEDEVLADLIDSKDISISDSAAHAYSQAVERLDLPVKRTSKRIHGLLSCGKIDVAGNALIVIAANERDGAVKIIEKYIQNTKDDYYHLVSVALGYTRSPKAIPILLSLHERTQGYWMHENVLGKFFCKGIGERYCENNNIKIPDWVRERDKKRHRLIDVSAIAFFWGANAAKYFDELLGNAHEHYSQAIKNAGDDIAAIEEAQEENRSAVVPVLVACQYLPEDVANRIIERIILENNPMTKHHALGWYNHINKLE